MTKINLETKARAGFEAIMLRGGRLVKRKGQVISFAPHVGQLSSVSCSALAAGLALGASLLGGVPAFAGTCDPLLPPPGTVVTCTGALDAANDATVVIDGEQVTVNTTPGFGISTSAGNGLDIKTSAGTEFGLIFRDNEASQIKADAGTALSINAVGNMTVVTNGTLVGGIYGIFAKNAGSGSTQITATGSVTGEGFDGINAINNAGTRNLEIIANVVTGGNDGINVQNAGGGFTLITATGNVEGTGTRNAVGISAVNRETATSLEIKANNANTVQGGSFGIYANNLGNGATSVSSTGDVTGRSSDGIFALNSGTTLTVDVNNVTGGAEGIDVQNDGDGFTFVTATGLVTGGAYGNGIEVNNAASATDLTISAAAVSGGVNGIFALNDGTGVTIVTATGLVGGTAVDGFTTADGIHVANSALGNTVAPAGQTVAPLIGMQVSAHDVNGGVNGIFADHNGAGGLVITADGTVNGRSATGISANNSTAGTYLTISAAAVTGGVSGIVAQNLGTGATFISASGDVSGGTGFGIYAENGDYAQPLLILSHVPFSSTPSIKIH